MASPLEFASYLMLGVPAVVGFVVERRLTARFFRRSYDVWSRKSSDDANMEDYLRQAANRGKIPAHEMARLHAESYQDSMTYHTETALETLSRLKLGLAAIATIVAVVEYQQRNYYGMFQTISLGLPYLFGGAIDAYRDWRMGLT